MRSNIHLFLFFLLLTISSFSRAQVLLPKWNDGDTLRYFITESELVEQERIQLEMLEIDVIIRKSNDKRSILEAHLHLQAKEGQGNHWPTFYRKLEQVPFTFYLDYGSAKTFDRPVQVSASKDAINNVLRSLLADDYIQPIPYNEITDWLGMTKEGGIPSSLLRYFQLLNPLFDKYGQPRESLGFLQFVNPISNCGDTTINVKWNLNGNSSYPNPDTLLISRELNSDSSNPVGVYQALVHCSQLEGLEDDEVLPTAYRFHQEEIWKAYTQTAIFISYAFTKKIEMEFDEMKTSRSWETRVLLLE